MKLFEDLNLSTPLRNGLTDLGFTEMTPIQEQAFPVILSGRDMIGIAQTGTGKTLGYMLPLLHELKYAAPVDPRILVLVPTRVKTCKKVVIDEVDVMLDLGFRFQLTNIFDHLPRKRQNIMFSATMTDQIEDFIKEYFYNPEKVSVAVSGTRLENIQQSCYPVENFYTKANLLKHLLKDVEEFSKVLVFSGNKKSADRLQEEMLEEYGDEIAVIHSNKTQNYRLRSIELFDTGERRILIATDVMARGLDLDKVSHVINMDTPSFPENYMHRIGRSGRAQEKGKTILFFTEKEEEHKVAIEKLMDYQIPEIAFPDEVEISKRKTPEEKPIVREHHNPHKIIEEERGASFHEKKDKNKKTNQGGSYRREIAKKYKKPKTRGDKNANRRRKK